MEIYDYTTAGGKNLIIEYIEGLSKQEKPELDKAIKRAKNEGLLK